MTIKSKLDEIYYSVIDSRFFRLINDFDKHVSRNLRNEFIEMRYCIYHVII